MSTVMIIPTPTGATVHARATAQNSGLSLAASLVPSFTIANAAIASVTPDTAGGGKAYAYRVIVTGVNGVRYATISAATADGADDLSLTGPSKANVIVLTGALPNAATVELYRVSAGGAVTNTTGLIQTITLAADGTYGGVTPTFTDTGAVATAAYAALSTPDLPTVTVYDGPQPKKLHPTSVQIGLESAATVYWTLDGSTPSATNGFLMTQLPSGIQFNLGGNTTAWDNFRITGTASMQCQFAYRQ